MSEDITADDNTGRNVDQRQQHPQEKTLYVVQRKTEPPMSMTEALAKAIELGRNYRKSLLPPAPEIAADNTPSEVVSAQKKKSFAHTPTGEDAMAAIVTLKCKRCGKQYRTVRSWDLICLCGGALAVDAAALPPTDDSAPTVHPETTDWKIDVHRENADDRQKVAPVSKGKKIALFMAAAATQRIKFAENNAPSSTARATSLPSGGDSAPAVKAVGSSDRTIGLIALTVLVVAPLVTWMIAAFSRSEEAALGFGLVAGILAFILGIVSRKDALGKFTAIAAGIAMIWAYYRLVVIPQKRAVSRAAEVAALLSLRDRGAEGVRKTEAVGFSRPDVATELSNRAMQYCARSRYSEAEPLFKRSLAIREKGLGPNHPDVATSLNNLALLYVAQGRYSDAEPLFKRSLAIDEKALGPSHPDVATSLNNLASLYVAQGRYSETESLLKRSLAIDEKALGPSHPDVATDLNNLAMLYKTQGRYSDAEPLLKRSLAIDEKALGPSHPDVATSLNNLALLYVAQGRYSDAEPLYTRSLAIKEKTLGPDHPDVATSLENVAVLYRKTGRDKDAEPLEQRAASIREITR